MGDSLDQLTTENTLLAEKLAAMTRRVDEQNGLYAHRDAVQQAKIEVYREVISSLTEYRG